MEGPWITPCDAAKCETVVSFVTGAGPGPRVVGLDGRERGGDVVIIDRIGRIGLADGRNALWARQLAASRRAEVSGRALATCSAALGSSGHAGMEGSEVAHHLFVHILLVCVNGLSVLAKVV